MRGKEVINKTILRTIRITPAHAGKSRAHGRRAPRRQDHPRACGEKLLHHRVQLGFQGSPPRMRGKVGGRATTTAMARITPAHAGKRQTRAAAVKVS